MSEFGLKFEHTLGFRADNHADASTYLLSNAQAVRKAMGCIGVSDDCEPAEILEELARSVRVAGKLEDAQ